MKSLSKEKERQILQANRDKIYSKYNSWVSSLFIPTIEVLNKVLIFNPDCFFIYQTRSHNGSHWYACRISVKEKSNNKEYEFYSEQYSLVEATSHIGYLGENVLVLNGSHAEVDFEIKNTERNKRAILQVFKDKIWGYNELRKLSLDDLCTRIDLKYFSNGTASFVELLDTENMYRLGCFQVYSYLSLRLTCVRDSVEKVEARYLHDLSHDNNFIAWELDLD